MSDYSNLSLDELTNTHAGMKVATLNAAAYLETLCGDADEARRHIRLALELPSSVLARRYDEAQAVMERQGELSIDETAAWIACAYFTIQTLTTMLEQKQSGATIQ